jgi:hypothetical protein
VAKNLLEIPILGYDVKQKWFIILVISIFFQEAAERLSMALAKVCLSAYLMSIPMGMPQARRLNFTWRVWRMSIR